jgi:predicted Fe-S protein YdhL (DUF1289 family)
MEITSTPCIAVCRIDPASGFCVGCGRTAVEIGAWIDMREPERLALMARLPDRFATTASLGAARDTYDAALASRQRSGRRRRS